MGHADARHENLGALDGGLIDDDGDPSGGVDAEGQANQPGGHLGTVEGGIAQQAVEPLGTGLFFFVEREGSGEGAQGESAVATARAAPKLEHGNRQQGQAEREPTSEFGARGGQQAEDAFNQGLLLGVEGAAGPALALVFLGTPIRTAPPGLPRAAFFRLAVS